ncbi:hypothetical protein MRS44_010128 [Fusarium solani]|uniref:uncharacterized protein n=1 Tax=Fusarium solani TaxID=169388 RepID=UPI0032C482E5|nr:hypothetical protein MRS44_010128 [Fusarium solani]
MSKKILASTSGPKAAHSCKVEASERAMRTKQFLFQVVFFDTELLDLCVEFCTVRGRGDSKERVKRAQRLPQHWGTPSAKEWVLAEMAPPSWEDRNQNRPNDVRQSRGSGEADGQSEGKSVGSRATCDVVTGAQEELGISEE